jgi:hypothetical protein
MILTAKAAVPFVVFVIAIMSSYRKRPWMAAFVSSLLGAAAIRSRKHNGTDSIGNSSTRGEKSSVLLVAPGASCHDRLPCQYCYPTLLVRPQCSPHAPPRLVYTLSCCQAKKQGARCDVSVPLLAAAGATVMRNDKPSTTVDLDSGGGLCDELHRSVHLIR